METEAPARPQTRPRSWLLILLGIAVVAIVAYKMWPSSSATPATATSKTNSRVAKTGNASGPIDPQELDVRLDELKARRPGPGEPERNPFRFAPKPPPPAPPPPPGSRSGGIGPGGVTPRSDTVVPSGPPQPPPIPLKFFGIVEKAGGNKAAALSDCRSTYYAREGDIIAGQYRLVKIGVESVVMEYPDGRGRTTIRLSGQECVGK